MPDDAIFLMRKKELCGRMILPLDSRSERHASTASRADRRLPMLRGTAI
jgi:hypothetical protein